MKSSHFIFFCLLTTACYLLSQTITSSSPSSSSSSSSSLNYLPSRRLMEELSRPSSRKTEDQKIEVLDEETRRSTMQEGSSAVEYTSSRENLDALVYHIDYHGVTTHPSPTPKHPKP